MAQVKPIERMIAVGGHQAICAAVVYQAVKDMGLAAKPAGRAYGGLSTDEQDDARAFLADDARLLPWLSWVVPDDVDASSIATAIRRQIEE